MNKKPAPKAVIGPTTRNVEPITPPADPIPKPHEAQRPRAVECKRCGWEWETQMKGDPRVCPRCKSYAWKVPRPIDDDF